MARSGFVQFSARVRFAALVLLALTCPAAAQDAIDWTPLPKRIDAVIGQPIVLPIGESDGHGGFRLERDRAWRPQGRSNATLITGEALETRLVLYEGIGALGAVGRWMPAPLAWRATPIDEVDRPAEGVSWFWAAVIEAPRRPVGKSLRVADRGLRVRWHDPPRQGRAGVLAPAPRASREEARALGSVLRPEFRDPLRRWRARLVAERFGGGPLWGVGEEPGRFDDADLEALAIQQEHRARLALDALQMIDPALAGGVATLMTGVVALPSGGLAPVWLVDETADRALFAELLDDERPEGERRLDAQAWLDARPTHVAWVIDEARSPARDQRRVTVGIANLSSERAICSAAGSGAPAENARTLEGLTSGVWTLDASAADLTRGVVVRAGSRAGTLGVVVDPLDAQPPGVALGPFFPSWTMAGWVTGRPARPERSWATLALLQRSAPDASGEGAWELFLECWTPAPGADDAVTIWLGDYEASETAIRVTADDPCTLRFSDRWTALVRLPAEVMGDRSEIGIGLVRRAGGGEWSWPRPMLPGEREPGRLRVRLGAWSPAADR